MSENGAAKAEDGKGKLMSDFDKTQMDALSAGEADAHLPLSLSMPCAAVVDVRCMSSIASVTSS